MKNSKKTRIIATIGPSSDSAKTIKNFVDFGVNIFRFNMKHNTRQWHKEKIKLVRSISKKAKILIDLQGPEIRIITKNKKDIFVKQNGRATVSLTHSQAIKALNKKDIILVDDGFVNLKVIKKNKKSIVLKALENCVIKNFKGVNLPGKNLDVPSLSKRDLENLSLAQEIKIDYIALSFVRNKNDINALKQAINKKNIKSKIVAKIETQSSIDNIDEIINASDMIMIARGDLGIETPIEKLAFYQKQIIKKCNNKKTPVIVATQMLHSMIESQLPTRAEATDVANAVLDGANALMLSNETAIGKYPLYAIKTMANIVRFNETLI